MKIDWTEDDIEVEKLASEPPKDFETPRAEQTKYFVEHAWPDQNASMSVTYVLVFKAALVGYVTVTMDELPLAKTEKPEDVKYSRVPAMKIAQMGIHKDYGSNGFGQYLVTHAIMVASQLKQSVGCRYVTLDAKTDLVGWYEKQGFTLNERDQEQRIAEVNELQMSAAKKESRLESLPISMRLDLHDFS